MNNEVIPVSKFIKELMALYCEYWHYFEIAFVKKGIRLDNFNNLTISTLANPLSIWNTQENTQKEALFSSWHGKIVSQDGLEYILSAVRLNPVEIKLTFELL